MPLSLTRGIRQRIFGRTRAIGHINRNERRLAFEGLEERRLLATGVPAGSGTGLSGEYYDNIDFTALALERVDSTVHFDWGGGSPDAAIDADTFSVRWQGDVEPLFSETYTFFTHSDDGVRLWVDGQLVINNWTDHAPMEDMGSIALAAGQMYGIELEYYENGGGAMAKLLWSSPSQPKEVIPESQLYPVSPLPPRAPENNAAFVSQGVPASMVAGQSYAVFVTFENTGTSTWTTNHKLGSQSPQDNSTWGTNRIYLAAGESIAQGQDKTFSFQVTAPDAPGAYDFQWRMVHEGVEWFGNFSPNVAVTVSAAPIPPGGGTGLLGEYYNNIDFTALALARTDSTVHFDWGGGSPHAAIDADTFSVRWKGEVEPRFSETYTFFTHSDDGVRLWVNGQLVIDNWTDHAPSEDAGSIALAAGQKYDIEMEYYENGGGAMAKLLWSSPSQPKQVIPQSQLFPATPPPPPTLESRAAFVSHVVPSTMVAGQSYDVSVTMLNTGTSTWTTDYRLGSQNPENNQTWGDGRIYLAAGELIAPGEDKIFSFRVTAPATPGTYDFQWRMVHEHVQWFGDFTPNVAVTVGPAPIPPGSGTGLLGEYYNNIDFTARALVRRDSTVNFNWGGESPHATIGAETFSVRWKGEVEPRFSETYTFFTHSDDGVRLWVNGELLIDNWTDHSLLEDAGSIALAGGQKYSIEMEYYENVGGAAAKLLWSSPSQTKEIIPQSQLYPAPGPPTPDPGGQLVLDEPLQGATQGTRGGGAFVSGGWQVTNKTDFIYWHIPTLSQGAVEWSVRGIMANDSRPEGADKNEIFHMYDWTFENADNNYSGYRNNPYKHFVRKSNVLNGRKTDSLELLWQILPELNEPDTQVLSWDPNTTYRFRQEWGPTGAGNSFLRTFRDGVLLMSTSVPGTWNPSGHAIRIAGSTRAPLFDDFGAPVGAVFSDLKVWDLSGGPPPPPPPPPGEGRTGRVRVVGNSLEDDGGPFLGLGASYFTSLWRARHDRAGLNSDLAFLSQRGFNYYRMLSMVGWNASWDGLEIAPVSFNNEVGKFVPAWPDYWQQLRDLIDIAYDTHGLRTQVTIFADAQLMPNKSNRIAHMDGILSQVIPGREHKIMLIEVANEGFQNGFPGSGGVADMREFAQYLDDRTTIPVAISDGDLAQMYPGSAADIATEHFSRNKGPAGGWEPVYDSWRLEEVPGVPPGSSNEPIGPGSSVSSENDPIKLVMGAAFAYVAKLPMYVFHSNAGVHHRTRFEDMPGVGNYIHLDNILPADVASWARNDGKQAGSPFTFYANGQPNQWWPDVGGSDGAVRTPCTKKSNEFVCAPIGIQSGGLEIEARETLSFSVYDPLFGVVVDQISMSPGQRVRLAQGPGAYIISNAATSLPPPPPPGNGTGLTGEYFDQLGFAGLALTRTDATVNFDWGMDSPDASIGPDTFSVRWTGEVEPHYSETYKFYTQSDDGVRLWVNGQLVIDNWTDHSPTEDVGSIALVSGQKFPIAMEYYENGFGATAKLLWSSARQPKQVIPQSQLYPVSDPPPPVLENSAQFVSQSVPTSMVAGRNYVVFVTIENTGTSTWATDHRLGSQNPQENTTWGTTRIHLASGETVAPGQSKTFEFTVTAPATVGTYEFQWRMVHENVESFGEFTPNVVVTVGAMGSEASPYGVVSAAGIGNDPNRQNDLQALGAGWARVAFEWPHMERTKGNIEWVLPDRIFNELTTRGINVYWDFSYAPCWANGRPQAPGGGCLNPDDEHYPPLNQQDLYDFVYAVVSRYKDRSHYWGTWNEVNLNQFYRGGVDRFVANELQTTVNAIKAADPTAKVVVGELSSSGNEFPHLKKILDATQGRFDVISHHVYDGGDTCSGRLAETIDPLRNSLISWGYGAYPLWVTETGLQTSDARKSSYLTCFYDGMKTRPWWTKTFWYRYEFEGSPGSSWGLLDGGPDVYTPNSTYLAFQNYIRSASQNGAAFVSQAVPTSMTAGQRYTVSVTMQNTGTTAWTTNSRLGSQNPQDNVTWGTNRIYLAAGETIAPGQNKTFTFQVTAPATPGTHDFQWRMLDEGVEWFGDFSPNVAVTVSAAPIPPGTGTGLTGQYYDNIDFTALALSRTDSTVNFDWVSGSPAASLGADTFSARWRGEVEPRLSEPYTFYTQSDDGVRLWVNGQLLINDWTDHGLLENQGTITLVAGQKYDLTLEYYENTGFAAAKLLWSSPSQPKEIIPRSQLYPSIVAAEVASRVGDTFTIGSNAIRHADAAFDQANGVYFVVFGRGPTRGRFVSSAGVPLGPDQFKIHETDAYTQAPRVAYSPDARGFLVTWLDTRANPQDATVWGRLVAFRSDGTPNFLSGDFQIAELQGAYPETAPAVAYSTVSREFLVAWMRGADIRARRISYTGALLGGEIAISSDTHWQNQPSIAYDADRNEFYVAYADADQVASILGRRVQAGTGALLGAVDVLDAGSSFLSIPEVQFDTLRKRFLVAWYDGGSPPPTLYGRFIHSGGGMAGAKFPIATGYSTYDALGLAFNSVSDSYFAVFHGLGAEDVGVQINGDGTLGPAFEVTATGATLGNFNPRVVANGVAGEWLVVTVKNFSEAVGQRIQGASGGPITLALSIEDVRVTEGNNGTVSASFPVSLSAPSTRTVSVEFATANGTATAGSDYTATSGTLSFAPGTTVQFVSVPVIGDLAVEADETFVVTLTSAVNATILDSQGVGTIVNDDVPSPAPMVTSIFPASGTTAGGTPVTINGTNFMSGATVTLGGVAATNVVIQSPTTITALPGPHAEGAVDVVVTNPDGQKGRLLQGFEYVEPRLFLGYLDAPSGLVSDAQTGFGWAFDCGGSITQYELLLDGVVQGGVSVMGGGSRPDVQAYFQAQCPSLGTQTGYNFTLDTDSLPAGDHSLQVRVKNERGETLDTNSLPISIQPPPPALVNAAAFVSQSVPASLTVGQTYSVSVTMRNTGTSTWTTDYRLGSQNPQDNSTWGAGRIYLGEGETIAPGQTKTFTFNVTAPATPGTYNFQWRMVHEHVEWFGQLTSNVGVTVRVPPPPPPPSPTTATVYLRARNGQYMVAEENGGGDVNANRDVAGPWETFTLTDLNGGGLRDGDSVTLRTGANWYLQAEGGGGGGFRAVGGGPGPWETFTIIKIGDPGGLIASGNAVALRTHNGHYVVAEEAGGQIVNANRTAIGPWEEFKIVIR